MRQKRRESPGTLPLISGGRCAPSAGAALSINAHAGVQLGLEEAAGEATETMVKWELSIGCWSRLRCGSLSFSR